MHPSSFTGLKSHIYFSQLSILVGLAWFFLAGTLHGQGEARTEISRWPSDKRGAVSITFDDGIITQFTVARPILDSLGLPATFYVITGKLPRAARGRFLGRNREDILRETVEVPSDSTNFFERASLIAFTGTSEALDYHSRAGEVYEAGRPAAAYRLMDEAYAKLLAGKLRDTEAVIPHDNAVDTTTWDDLRRYQEAGHEIGSHTVTHARLAVLDEANLLYELQQSQKDLLRRLGPAATFTAEVPYGTEDERVMAYAHGLYPALRNRMPAPYLAELNRGSTAAPGAQTAEYVQWQRGPVDGTSLTTMENWIDTTLAHDNVWLVEVFHGVDDYGWAARPGAELRQYFTYIKDKEDSLWIAPFGTVTKYVRQRMTTEVTTAPKEDGLVLTARCDLDPLVYDVPLTYRTYLPPGWTAATLETGETITPLSIQTEQERPFVRYALPPTVTEWSILRN